MTLQSPGINLESNLHRCMALLEKLLVLTMTKLILLSLIVSISNHCCAFGLTFFFQIGKLKLSFSPLERNTANFLTHDTECILFQDHSFANTSTLRLTGTTEQ